LVKVGSEITTLVVIRGNSASGKSTIAAGIRAKCGPGVAIVGQDHLRRVVLKEKDKPGANIGMIDLVTLYALDHGYTTVLEGILYAAHYGEMLTGLRDDHLGQSLFYYMDVPFEETLRRHAAKPQAKPLRARRNEQLVAGPRLPAAGLRAGHHRRHDSRRRRAADHARRREARAGCDDRG